MATNSLEINQADILCGARAVNPNISIDDLLHLAEDSAKLESIKNAKELHLLVTGKTGTGKSMLINGLIGAEVAEVSEGLTTSGVTTKVEPYCKEIDGIKVVVYDSPGLEDGSGKEKAYLDELYKKCREGIDLVVFAIRMAENRFVPGNPDARAMVKFTTRFKPPIWKKTIIILTCANACEALNPQLRSKSRKAKQIFFRKIISDYKNAIHKTLVKEARVPDDIVEKVKVVPTGFEYESELLDGTLWFTNFWFECLTAIPTIEGKAAIIKVNARRFKRSKDVTNEDVMQPLAKQPIVVKEEEKSKKSTLVTVGTVLGPALAGAALGATGFIAGPVGVVGIPLGFFIGMTLGAIGTALRHHKELP